MMPQYIDYAEYYDYDHAAGPFADVPFYLYYAQQCGSPLLELACGTGRVLIPLAQAGFALYGVDVSEKMLAVCRRKVEEHCVADRVHLMQANMASFDLPCKDFALVYIPVRAFMHLFTLADQLACLHRVYAHLRVGGLFIVDLYTPSFPILAQTPDSPFIVRREFDLPNGHHIIRKDRFVCNDLVHQIHYSELRFEEYDRTGRLVGARTLPMHTRYTFRYELQLLLERVGFELLDLFRDYAKSPYNGTGEILAVACRPR
jgi:SAM-dependent methyltransferase